VIATPIIATVGVPLRIVFALGVVAIVCAVLLAAFGAITAVALMRRMHAGQYLLPRDLRLPLPPGMRPRLVAGSVALAEPVDGAGADEVHDTAGVLA
jgi:hypothetical protein